MIDTRPTAADSLPPLPDLIVLPGQHVHGLEAFVADPSAGSGIRASIYVDKTSSDGRPYTARVDVHRFLSFERALTAFLRSDDHFVSYRLFAPDGTPSGKARRINKAAGASLVELGGRIEQCYFAADFDNRAHAKWGKADDPVAIADVNAIHALVDRLTASVPPTSPLAGMVFFASGGGMKAIAPLKSPLTIGAAGKPFADTQRYAEAVWRGWRAAVERELVNTFITAGFRVIADVTTGAKNRTITAHYAEWTAPSGRAYHIPLTPDSACGDWTRLVRLPFTRRDGKPVVEWTSKAVIDARVAAVVATRAAVDHSLIEPLYKPGESPADLAERARQADIRRLAREAVATERARVRRIRDVSPIPATRMAHRRELAAAVPGVATDWWRNHDTPGFLRAIGYFVGNFRPNGSAPCECPNKHEHSDGRGDGRDDSTILWMFTREDGTTGYRIHCSHKHCIDNPDAIALINLFNAEPDLANSFGTIPHEPTPAALTLARHARMRAGVNPPADFTADEIAALDRLCAIERERAIAADNERIESAEVHALDWLTRRSDRAAICLRASLGADVNCPMPSMPPAADRERDLSILDDRIRYADSLLKRGVVDLLQDASASIGRCRRGKQEQLRGPQGVFSVRHPCHNSCRCSTCAGLKSDEWCERTVWGGVANLAQHADATVVFFRVDLDGTTVESTHAAYLENHDRIREYATDHGIPFISHYVDEQGDAADTVRAHMNCCAIVPADAKRWSIPGIIQHSMPVATATADHRVGDIEGSPYWKASATIGAWIASHRTPSGAREWLSPAAAVRAEEALIESGRKKWRTRLASRLWSRIFPRLPSAYEREAEFIDDVEIEALVASRKMRAPHAASIYAFSTVANRRRVEAATQNDSPLQQPIPFGRKRSIANLLLLLAAWTGAAARADVQAAADARAAYIEANEAEGAAIRALARSHAGVATASSPSPPAGACVGA